MHHSELDDSGIRGVAIAINRCVHSTPISWGPISLMIAIARFLSTLFNGTVTAIYVPTIQTKPAFKDAFYNELQRLVNCIPMRQIVLNEEDWNQQVSISIT